MVTARKTNIALLIVFVMVTMVASISFAVEHKIKVRVPGIT